MVLLPALTSSLTTTKIPDAEERWLKPCQATQFQDEIANMQTNSRNSRLSLVKQLRLYLDSDGIIRCGGKIHNASLGYAAKFPYLLPNKHELTKLSVFDAHENQLHSGVNCTITQLRQKYCIPSIRQCVRSLLRTCVKCTRVIGRPYRTPAPPPLPKVRVEEAPSFLQAFRRFTSHKSLPKVIISDNATTYTAAANTLASCSTHQPFLKHSAEGEQRGALYLHALHGMVDSGNASSDLPRRL